VLRRMELRQVLLFIPIVLIPGLDAAKGGAKSIMGRKKNQQNSMNTHVGYHGHASQRDRDLEDFDGSGDYDYYPESEPPCVGLCFLLKLRGEQLPAPILTRPCVGKCQHRRELGITAPPIRRRRKPCVGLCFITKKRAEERRKKKAEEKEKMEKNKKLEVELE